MPLTNQDVGPCNCGCGGDQPCEGSICMSLTANCSWAMGMLGPSIEITDESTGLVVGGGPAQMGSACFAVPPGTYSVAAIRRGCVTKTWPGVVVGCSPVELTGEMTCSTIRYRFQVTAPVCDPPVLLETFTGPTSASPLWASVPMTTDGAGAWEAYVDTSGIGAAGFRAFRISHPRCTPYNGQYNPSGVGNCLSPTVGLFNLSCTQEFRQSTITVLGVCHGEPIAGAAVSVRLGIAAHAAGVTDADGRYTFTRAGNGEYSATITSPVATYAGGTLAMGVINRCATPNFTRTLLRAPGRTCDEIPPPMMMARTASEAESPAYPPLMEQAANLAKAAGRFIASGLATVDRAEFDRRHAICEACPTDRFDADRDACRSCGCHLAVKPWSKAEHCPDGHW